MIKLQPPPSPVARVLVVEDDAELREDILVPGLAGFGFATEGVASAEALYRRFVAAPSELVVLDIGLPQEDGLSAAAHLRHRDVDRHGQRHRSGAWAGNGRRRLSGQAGDA